MGLDDILKLSVDDVMLELDKMAQPEPEVKNAITEHFKLPKGALHTDYRIVMIGGQEICVHKDFVDLVMSL